MSKHYYYDPALDRDYQNALAQRAALLTNKPVLEDPFRAQTQDLYQKITSRKPFSYDPEADPLYTQYRSRQLHDGRLAMQDAIGRAATRTGGYSNSYAQTVGQQTYGEYLHKLGQALPEFYALSRQNYDADTEALYRQYTLSAQRSQESYDRYRDAMGDYQKLLDTAQKQADTAYERGYNQWLTALKLEQEAQKLSLQQTNAAYDRLVELVLSGYQPTDRELARAGMTRQQAQALWAWETADERLTELGANSLVAGVVDGAHLLPQEEEKSYWQRLWDRLWPF